jgi:hypothetical protein
VNIFVACYGHIFLTGRRTQASFCCSGWHGV